MITEPDADLAREYKAAMDTGQFLVRLCVSCGEHHDYPRQYCPFCGSGETKWVVSTGSAEVLSYTIWRRKPNSVVPAYITLPEGPVILGTIGGDNPEEISIGDSVEFRGLGSGSGLPVFELITTQPTGQASGKSHGTSRDDQTGVSQ